LRRIVTYQLLGALQMGTFGLLFNLYLLALGHKEDLIGIVSGVPRITSSTRSSKPMGMHVSVVMRTVMRPGTGILCPGATFCAFIRPET